MCLEVIAQAEGWPIQARFWLEWGSSELDRVFLPLFHVFVSSIPTRSALPLTAGYWFWISLQDQSSALRSPCLLLNQGRLRTKFHPDPRHGSQLLPSDMPVAWQSGHSAQSPMLIALLIAPLHFVPFRSRTRRHG